MSETNALNDALARILGKGTGDLSNDDIIQLLAYMVGGIANIERRLTALETQAKSDYQVWA